MSNNLPSVIDRSNLLPPWCSIVGATVTVHQFFCILHFCHICSLCHVELVVQFFARGSTQVLLCLFPGVLWLWHFLYSVGQHPVSNLHIYTFVVSRASMGVRLAKQETLTPPGHLVSPLVCRGPWMSTVVFYCWCHSDSASVLLYLSLLLIRKLFKYTGADYFTSPLFQSQGYLSNNMHSSLTMFKLHSLTWPYILCTKPLARQEHVM